MTNEDGSKKKGTEGTQTTQEKRKAKKRDRVEKTGTRGRARNYFGQQNKRRKVREQRMESSKDTTHGKKSEARTMT